MTAVTANASAVTPTSSPRLLGLRNLVRKDASEWTHGKRPWIVLALTSMVFVLAAANSAINQWVLTNVQSDAGDLTVKQLTLVPLDNLVLAIATQFTVIAVIFATMSLIVSERESGTLAWTLSKPVSRTSVLVSKWLTASAALWLLAVAIPIVIAAIAVTLLYGAPDVAVVIKLTVLLATVPAIYAAITIAAATFVPSQAAVGAIGLALFVLPTIVGSVAPAVADFFPTSILGWALAVATGSPASIATPIAWALGIVALFIVARRRLSQTDL